MVERKPDLGTLIAAVAEARTTLLDRLAGLTDRQAAFKPGGGWSVTEILEHLYLAELAGVARIWMALESVEAGQRWNGDLPHRGLSIEAIVASTWKDAEVAPPNATPRMGGPLGFWIAATRSLQPVLEDLAAHLSHVDLEAVVFPHYLSGPLDARQRLEFLRFHIERHTAQVDRIRQAADFPRPE